MFRTYNTRTKEGLHIDFIRSSLGQRCIKYKGSVLWNLLPDELRNVESTKSFCMSSLVFLPAALCWWA